MDVARRCWSLIALLLSCGYAAAQGSATVGVVSDYDSAAISLSASKPALQAGAEYELDNGLAVGTWASTVDLGDRARYELDFSLSYGRSWSESAEWVAGLERYTWPHSSVLGSYSEVYVSLNVKSFSLTQRYAESYTGSRQAAWYTDLSLMLYSSRYIFVTARAGYSYGRYWSEDGEGLGSLLDYSISVDRRHGAVDVGIKFVGTNAHSDQKITTAVFNNTPRLILSLSLSFPHSRD